MRQDHGDCLGCLRNSVGDFLELGRTINGDYYASLLEERRPVITQKRRGKMKGVLLLQDNIPVHKNRMNINKVIDCGLEFLPHPPYSPDLEPSDCHLFPTHEQTVPWSCVCGRWWDESYYHGGLGEVFNRLFRRGSRSSSKAFWKVCLWMVIMLKINCFSLFSSMSYICSMLGLRTFWTPLLPDC